jgi:hypothetical protein
MFLFPSAIFSQKDQLLVRRVTERASHQAFSALVEGLSLHNVLQVIVEPIE